MVTNSITAKPKFKKCRNCENRFQVFRSTQKACSPNCALELVRLSAAKKEAKVNREAKRKFNDGDRSIHIKKTQQIFNRYIRLRDCNDPCISCRRHHAGQYHAGHYRTVGANPELRFDERNCYKQCAPCNNHLSGNIVNFRIALISKFGDRFVADLEGPHKAKKYTIPELKELQELYKSKIKELEI